MSEPTPNDGNPEDETPEDEQAQDNQAQDEQARAGIDFIAAVADERIKRYFKDNWPDMIGEVAGAVAEKINVEGIAVKAAKIFEDRWNEAAAKNQVKATGADGGGGGGGSRPTAEGSDGGGDGGDDLGFLTDLPSGDASNSQPLPAPVPEDPKQAVALAGLRALADPVDTIERVADVIVKLLERRKPPTVPRNDFDVVAEIAKRRPEVVDYYASPDPLAPGEKLGEMLQAGVKSGMRISETMAKHASGLSRRAPKFEVPKVELVDPPRRTPPTPPTPPTPEPAAAVVAPMAQDPAPKRRRRKLSDVV